MNHKKQFIWHDPIKLFVYYSETLVPKWTNGLCYITIKGYPCLEKFGIRGYNTQCFTLYRKHRKQKERGN